MVLVELGEMSLEGWLVNLSKNEAQTESKDAKKSRHDPRGKDPL